MAKTLAHSSDPADALGLEVVIPNTEVEDFWEQLSWENAARHPAIALRLHGSIEF